MKKTSKKILFILSICISVFLVYKLSTLIFHTTHYTKYSIEYNVKEGKNKFSSAYFLASKNRTIINKWKDTMVFGNPYKYDLTIEGNFDRVEVTKADLRIDGTVKKQLGKGYQQSAKDNETYFIVSEGNIELPIENAKRLDIQVEFIGTKNGVSKTYKEVVPFQIKKTIEKGNVYVDWISEL